MRRLTIHNLGFPRIGPRRELKQALEGFWSGRLTEEQLLETARSLRADAWQRQKRAGVDWIPCNDFSLYDHVLDMTVLVGCLPERFGWKGGEVPLSLYFAMARGGPGLPPLELTKWFDTNYHYLVPEVHETQRFCLASDKPFREFAEARAAGVTSLPVLLGPLTFLALAKPLTPRMDKLRLLTRLLPVYAEALDQLAAAGAAWVQLDEPILVTDLEEPWRRAMIWAYERLRQWSRPVRILVATYFGGLAENLSTAYELAVDGLHLDLVRTPADEIRQLLQSVPRHWTLSLGVVDGRNIWRARMHEAWKSLRSALESLGPERIWVAPSCSLLHVPLSLSPELRLDPNLRPWLAFAEEKLEELRLLGELALEPEEPPTLRMYRAFWEERARDVSTCNPVVRARTAETLQQPAHRPTPYAARQALQTARLNLPLLPTTTIGSFPQDSELRRIRTLWKRGQCTTEQYHRYLKNRIVDCIRTQEAAGLDVLVHGEFERSDMVEYFAEHLAGFALTDHGWVQSYGSRCIKPPILYGDVHRPDPITVQWWQHAQSCTAKPVKGILTGPVTILQWSFVREDLPRPEVARQLALALRDEVRDLEEAGCRIIQIDEPALGEGMPLRAREHDTYLAWALQAFRMVICQVRDDTQIHSHMCYCDFDRLTDALRDLDLDVLSLEAARSGMAILTECARLSAHCALGPGIWDVHSPHVPDLSELLQRIEIALQHVPADQLWINPDCGLKTRTAEEVEAALRRLVEAAKRARARMAASKVPPHP